jgi:hypothetical protein
MYVRTKGQKEVEGKGMEATYMEVFINVESLFYMSSIASHFPSGPLYFVPNPSTSSCQHCILQMLPEIHSFTVIMWISAHYICFRELCDVGLSLQCINDIRAISGFYAASVRNCCSQTSDEKLPEAPMPNRTTIYKVHEELWKKLVL